MAYQDVLFGSFTSEEASDLCTLETSALQFVWLDKRKPPKPKYSSGAGGNHSLTIPSAISEEDGRSFSPSLLSPNIPPNPPTSPVDEPTTAKSRKLGAQASVALKKLNVNAVPFVPGLGAMIGNDVTPQASLASKNGEKVVKKLDFEAKGEGSKESSEESSIPWGAVNYQIPPPPRPCGNIQTSGQVTSECRTASAGGPRESEQSQCQSQDDHVPCAGMGVVTSSNIGDDSMTAEKVDHLPSSIAPLEMPPAALLDTGDISPLDSSSQTQEVWPNIPSSPPPPLPLPPSHYQKADLPRLDSLSYVPSALPPSVSLSEGTSHFMDDSPAAIALASVQSSSNKHCPVTPNSPICQPEDGNETVPGLGSFPSGNGVGPGLGDSQPGNGIVPGLGSIAPGNGISSSVGSISPVLHSMEQLPTSVALSPLTTPTLLATPTTVISLAPIPISSSDTPSSSSVTSPSVPSLTTPTTGGAWGSNRVRSWASIFKEPTIAAGQRQLTPTVTSSKLHTRSMATPPCGEGGAAQERTASDAESAKVVGQVGGGGDLVGDPICDIQLRSLGDQLQAWTVCHRPRHVLPRGLINSGNWCYVHAPLQALLSIPSMWHLFRTLNPNPPPSRGPSSTPFSSAMCRFFHEFQDYPKSSQPPPSSGGAQGGFKKKKGHRADLASGDPFLPKYIYDMLQKVRSNLSYKGRQEDAEEFLGCLLDGLHEEMVSARRLISGQETEDKAASDVVEVEDHTHLSSPSLSAASSSCDLKQQQQGENVEKDEWEQVGPKNKSTITRQMSFSESPITEIFGGKSRSALHRQGARESATMEPFFSLQLDIQSEGITSVKEALETLATKETVHVSEVDAYKRLTLARLPPVLVFHFKRFVFASSGSQKLFKFISYSMDMEIAKDLLAPTIKNKVTQSQRSYKLWAVVYHHGKTATGGHYTCDAFHSGSGGWIRVDDGVVKPIPEDFVLTPGGGIVNKTAYLLFYRRLDTVL